MAPPLPAQDEASLRQCAYGEAARHSIAELAETALGMEVGETRLAGSADVPTGYSGACIPLVSDDGPVEVAVLSTARGLSLLTRAMLQMTPDEPEPTEDDVTDTMNEIANIVAGCVKTRMTGCLTGLRIGFPAPASSFRVEPRASVVQTELHADSEAVPLTVVVQAGR